MERKDSEVSQFLKKIFGLSLLPPEEVSECFALDFISNLLNDKRVGQFRGYLLENYSILMQIPLFLRLFIPNVLHRH
jgi:hypothetical protein